MGLWAWLTLAVYCSTLFAFELGSARTLSAHESFIAQISREMLASGDWLVPRIGGKPWLEKPPLPYWIVAALGAVAGEVDELVARLPSAAAGLIGVLILSGMTARWFGPTIGLLAGLIQATTIYTLTYARLAEMDIYLWALVLGCLAVAARSHVGPSKAPPPWYCGRMMFFVLLGLTQLCKGLLFGAAMVLIPLMGYVLWQRDWRLLRWLCYLPGMALALGMSAAWPAAIVWRHPEAIELWWVHTFGRMGDARCINPEPIWYYFTTIPWQTLPWTPAILAGLAASWRRGLRYGQPADRFLWLWFMLPLIALSLVRAKHHHYLIYALPPCSIWAAEGLVRSRALISFLLRHPNGRWGLAVSAATVLGGLGLWAYLEYVDCFWGLAALAAMYVAGAVAAAAGCALRYYRAAAVALFATLWCMCAHFHAVLHIRFDSYAADTELLQRVGQHGEETPIFVYGVFRLTDSAAAPTPGVENFDRINPARVLVYLPPRTELFHDLHDLERRIREKPEALIVSTVGFEGDLRRLGEPERLDQTPGPRSAKWGDYSHLAAYRLQPKNGEARQAVPTSDARPP